MARWGWFMVRWRHWIRPAVMALYGLIILVLFPLICWRLSIHGASPSDQAWFAGGFFTLLALPISFWEITQHLVHYTKPYLQKHIIRILWMVPIYALDAWLALTHPSSGIYLDTCRECYEAYVIYNFMAFLLNFLRYDVVDGDVDTKVFHPQLFPLCLFPPCIGGPGFIEACKKGILNYTIIRPLTTIASLICELCGVYGEGEFSATNAYPYICAVNNVSQFAAMYSLAMFYMAFREQLKPMNPLAKFMCIKAVVFFSFFQSVIISILAYVGIIHASFTTHQQDVKQISRSLQDFLICIEMFLASVAHYYAFSHKPYIDRSAPHVNCCTSFMAMWDVSDVTQDVSQHIRQVGNHVKRTMVKRAPNPDNEKKCLIMSLEDEDDSPLALLPDNTSKMSNSSSSSLPAIAQDLLIDLSDQCSKS